MKTKIPRGQFGPNHDGTADPDKITPAERMTTSEARLIAERARRNSPSPLIREQQAATDKALGRNR
ncbi:MAG: hypothetical protein ACYDDU_07335 [Dermatophilaceae bacterium]